MPINKIDCQEKHSFLKINDQRTDIIIYLRNKSLLTQTRDHDLRYFIFSLMTDITKGSFLDVPSTEQRLKILGCIDEYKKSEDLVVSYSGQPASNKLKSLDRLIQLINDFYTLDKKDLYNKN